MDTCVELYERFLCGDNDSFKEIVEMYGPNLIFFINGYVNNLSVAEDLMEDTFCDLIFYKKRYTKSSSFKTYLFSIARNKSIDYIRKINRHRSVPYEEVEAVCARDNSLEEKVVRDENVRFLYKALEQLTDDYRSVLYLFYFESMSYDEIGRALKKSNKQIKNMMYRAKKSLKAILEMEGFKYEGHI